MVLVGRQAVRDWLRFSVAVTLGWPVYLWLVEPAMTRLAQHVGGCGSVVTW